MIPYPNIGPNLIHIGRLRVRWYGIMYLLGFVAGRFILQRLCRKKFLRMPIELVDDCLVAIFIGMLIGARTLYMLVYYDPGSEAWHWYTPFAVWEGGLAFHGGAIGIFLALAWFAWRHKVRFWNLADSLTLAAPAGIAFGRLGNFINSELWGRETNVPWAMSFPIRDYGGSVVGWTTPRHPSQLYESFGEGVLGLLFIWSMMRLVPWQGMLSGLGMVWYGAVRFLLEFFREKDVQMRYYFGWMTMGQVLCLLTLFVGIVIVMIAVQRRISLTAPSRARDKLEET
jgi:phosphatidylglycerol:prolipoprotein diacylglycerol transferase